MKNKLFVPVILIAIVIIALEVMTLVILGFDPSLSVLVVFAIACLLLFVCIDTKGGDNK